MAVVSASRVASALATLFQDRIADQMNRSVVTLQLLPHQASTGQNIQWDAAFSASSESTDSTIADGADVSVYQDDDLAPAVLQYGNYSEAFSLTGRAMAIARAAKNPKELEDLFGHKIERAVRRLTKNIGKAIFTGSGATNHIHGLMGGSTLTAGAPLAATGTYAGLARGTYAAWASTNVLNGGTPRALSFAIMRDTMRGIYEACGETPDLIVCDAAQHDAYAELFGAERRYVDNVAIRGETITLRGGHKALEFDGIPVIKDVNCPAGVMLFLNSNYVRTRQLEDSPNAVNGSMGMVNLHGSAENQFGARGTMLSARINPLARTGDAYKFQLILYPQLQVEHPNTCGVLGDLS